MGDKTQGDDGTTLLGQPDFGGGQAPPAPSSPGACGRPQGTAPVGKFAGEGGEWPPTPVSEPWRVAPGEAEAACEDGFPGDEALRLAEAVEAGVFPGVTSAAPIGATRPGDTGGGEREEVRGALYAGPERRKTQEDWGWWQCEDRRERPFSYAGEQQV